MYAAGRVTASEVRERMPAPPSYSARSERRCASSRTRECSANEHEGKRHVHRATLLAAARPPERPRSPAGYFFGGSAAGAVMTLLEEPRRLLTQDEPDRMAQLIERARKEGR